MTIANNVQCALPYNMNFSKAKILIAVQGC